MTNLKVFLLLFIVLLLAYASSFNGTWVLDDKANITKNDMLQIESLNLETLMPAVFESGLDFPRPFSMLTLALNWYVGGDNIVGYHLVNFVIHVLNAFFLFLCIKLLFNTPVGRRLAPDRERVFCIALFAALLWALHPIQIQGVTYIVQRMASLSALFCIISLYYFLRGKLALNLSGKLKAYGLCALSFLMGMASKENAAVLPCILLLTYAVFFREQGLTKKQKLFFGFLTVGALVVIAGMAFWYYPDILKLYEARFFTPEQRLMTESRVMFLYLSQIFWPLPSRFSIEHYVPLSTSLLSPVTTLLSMIAIIVLIALALYKMRRWPLFSFAILFFLGCHVIESTIMPLELVYEHRNYLPAMFIGLPLAYWFFRLWDRLKTRSLSYAKLLMAAGAAVLIFLGVSTHLRNYLWADEIVLYEAAIARYPEASRAHLIIAEEYHTYNTPQADALAIAAFEKAFGYGNFNSKNEYSQGLSRYISLNILMGEIDNAIMLAAKYTIKDFDELLYATNSFWESGNFAIAREVFAKITGYIDAGQIQNATARNKLLANMGFGYTFMQQYPEAYASYLKLFNSETGNKKTAAWFLLGLANLQHQLLPDEPLAYLKSLPVDETAAVFEFLYNNQVIPQNLKSAWLEIYNQNFKN